METQFIIDFSAYKIRRVPIMGVTQLHTWYKDGQERSQIRVGRGNPAIGNVLGALFGGNHAPAPNYRVPLVLVKPEDFTKEETNKLKFYWHGMLDLDDQDKNASLRRDLAYFGGRQTL